MASEKSVIQRRPSGMYRREPLGAKSRLQESPAPRWMDTHTQGYRACARERRVVRGAALAKVVRGDRYLPRWVTWVIREV
jgi:hypothetical protein